MAGPAFLSCRIEAIAQRAKRLVAAARIEGRRRGTKVKIDQAGSAAEIEALKNVDWDALLEG